MDSRYRVLRLLGAGGMGSVYEVEHTQLDKRFVLKALHREYTDRDDLVDRLKTEWLSLAKLEHPNIVNVTDAGTSVDGVAFFVMEKLDGETLSARIKRRGALSVDEALGIGRDILDGLAAAHRIGVVHRDVKPANVLLTEAGATKLLDFGIAKVMSNKTITAHGVAIGTPRYMSPEQARGEHVDSRADIYAAGLLLYEMLAGQGPFSAIRDTADLIYAQLFEAPLPPSSFVERLDRELDELCVSLLAKAPGDRPESASELAKRLATIRRRLQSQAAPQPGSTQTTVPGALAQTSAALPTAPRRRRSAIGARATSATATTANERPSGGATRTEPLRAPPVAETRTSSGPSEGDSLATHTNSSAPPNRRTSGSSRLVWSVIGVVAIGAVGAAGAWRLRSTDSPLADTTNQTSSPPSGLSAPTVAAEPVPEPAAAPPATIKLTIDSAPSGAEVFRQPANVRVGKTPYDTTRAPTEGQIVFTLVKAGHVTEEVAMNADEDGRREVALSAVPKRKRKYRPAPAPKPVRAPEPAPEPEAEPEAAPAPPPDVPSTTSGQDRTIDPWQQPD